MESLKSITTIVKDLPKPFKIFLIIILGMLFLVLLLKIGDFVYCHTVVICDYVHPTMSPEMVATLIPLEYEETIRDINAGRYEIAKLRLEYIIHLNPEYTSAREKLLEIEKILKITPTP